MKDSSVFLLDDDADLRHALSQGLELAGFSVVSFENAVECLGKLHSEFSGVVICDIRMPGMDGIQFLEKAVAIDNELPIVMITGHGDVPLAVEAMRKGAYDFLEKPFPSSRLSEVVERGIEKRDLVLENRQLRAQLRSNTDLSRMLVGASEAMKKLRDQVKAVAGTSADVLVFGETGTGKEVVARAIHRLSVRRERPFVAINCGALPKDIIESELFGHEKGAFTGAQQKRVGKLEYADGGTVLLDEIESMPLDLQVKLLRVLEDRAIERLGSNQSIPVDLRFIAATKTDLREAGESGMFRSDLYYRLDVVTITLPALRQHREDISQIFHHLVHQAAIRFDKQTPTIPPDILATVNEREWPGNVRELRNAADRFVLGIWGEESAHGNRYEDSEAGGLADLMAAHEKELIRASLARHGGRIKPVYEELGIGRKTLYEKMKRYALN